MSLAVIYFLPQVACNAQSALRLAFAERHANAKRRVGQKQRGEELQKIHDGRRRGPQLLGDILPIVLARLGVGVVQSEESGE
jgi:hypothetical protein